MKLEYEIKNVTLNEIDRLIERENKESGHISYRIGMGIIGDECLRKAFYKFREPCHKELSADTLAIFADGHLQEDLMAERLRKKPTITLYTKDPNDPEKQIPCVSELGHFKGYLDGMILGINEAPKTWHVWEHKAVNDKKFDALNKLKDTLGDKDAFSEWDYTYYIQGILYMYYQGVTRHFLTVTTPGGRRRTSCRTNANNALAKIYEEKAHSVIFDSNSIPHKISEKPDFYKCKMCDFKAVCQDGDFPLPSCKTCRYREPVKDGDFLCHKTNLILDKMAMNTGCDNHIYNHILISDVELVSSQDDCVILKIKNTTLLFANTSLTGLPVVPDELKDIPFDIYTSKELYNNIKNIENLKSAAAMNLQKKLSGTFQDVCTEEIEVKTPFGKAKAWDVLTPNYEDESINQGKLKY